MSVSGYDMVVAVITVAIIMGSIIVHEVSHGAAAYKLGDPTAHMAGRLSLNPLKHIDPIGTVILPLILFLSGLPVFGYAKPVPYNPNYFKNRKRDEVVTALAGPLSNLLLACVFALLMAGVNLALRLEVLGADLYGVFNVMKYPILMILFTAMHINLVLMCFNLLPLPPLDGSKCISYFLNHQQMQVYYRIQQYSMPLLFILIFIVPRVMGFDPLGIYLNSTVDFFTNLLLWWL